MTLIPKRHQVRLGDRAQREQTSICDECSHAGFHAHTCSKKAPGKQHRVFVPLSNEPFRNFEAGRKTVEVRGHRSPVARQVRAATHGKAVVLRLGWNGSSELYGTLGRVWFADNLDALDPEAKAKACLSPEPNEYFDPLDPLIAFEVLDLNLKERDPQ